MSEQPRKILRSSTRNPTACSTSLDKTSSPNPVENTEERNLDLHNSSEVQSGSRKRGRPSKEFADLSRTGKIRRVQQLDELNNNDTEALTGALIRSLKPIRPNLAKLIKVLEEKSEEDVKNILEGLSKPALETYTAEECIDFKLHNKLSQNTLVSIMQEFKARHINVFPTKQQYLDARKECYPKEMIVSELKVEIPINSLIDHTILRTYEALSIVIDAIISQSPTKKIIETSYTFSYGWDASSDHSRYNIKCPVNVNDSTIISSTLSYLHWETTDGKIIFQNPAPGSIRFCRPLALEFAKETDAKARLLYNTYSDSIKQRKPLQIKHKEYMVNL